jgi:hypothetical protein
MIDSSLLATEIMLQLLFVAVLQGSAKEGNL